MSGSAEPAKQVAGADKFDRPIQIISPPRSGSTLLFETLSQAPGVYTIRSESHRLIEGIPGLHPVNHNWESNRLTADDARSETVEALLRAFYERLQDRNGEPPEGAARFLEKTPKNSLRIPFFDSIWPDSTFIYLYRDVRQTLASMMEAWVSGRFRTYRQLPGWTGRPWSLLLVPGWQKLQEQPLPVIVAHQWATATQIMLEDLAAIPKDRLRAIRYSDLVTNPNARAAALAQSLDLQWDRELGDDLPLSAYTVSKPDPDKWRRLEQEIEAVMPIVEPADSMARKFVASFD